MAATVATPLEKQFSTIAGIDNMTSTSSLGQTQIVIQFALDRNIDAAAQDVQAAIAQTMRSLPQGIIPPSYQKTNPADAPILTLALTSNEVPLSTLDEYGETTLAQRLSMVGGVAQVLVYGAQKYAVRMQLDPGAARDAQHRARGRRDRGHDAERQPAHRRALGAAAPRSPCRRPASSTTPTQFRDLIVAYRNGAPVHLERDRPHHRRRAEQQDGELVQRRAVDRAGDPAPAGHEHRRRREPRQGGARASSRRRSRRRSRSSTLYDRSATIQASVRRRDVHARAHARARRARDLPVPAQPLGDDHPEPRAADVDHRHVLGDVPAALQPRQPVADGAHARRRASWSTTRS